MLFTSSCMLYLQKEMDSLLATQEKLRQRNTDLTTMLSQIKEKKVVTSTKHSFTLTR